MPDQSPVRFQVTVGSSLPGTLQEMGYKLFPVGTAERLILTTETLSEHGRQEKIQRDHVGIAQVAAFEFDLPCLDKPAPSPKSLEYDQSRFMPLVEASQRFGIPAPTLHSARTSGAIASQLVKGRAVIAVTDVERMAAKRGARATVSSS
jgi:hypothetical protein